ncbi:hypothetical protein ACFO5X_23520 [Seohaeicola nanhaiensis]|uniref:PAS domain-containing protein n=1 Tax=Seohaeicola nanhaiensis TaxID=1387282 RepID=A0ABV9KNL0_9RHOB
MKIRRSFLLILAGTAVFGGLAYLMRSVPGLEFIWRVALGLLGLLVMLPVVMLFSAAMTYGRTGATALPDGMFQGLMKIGYRVTISIVGLMFFGLAVGVYVEGSTGLAGTCAVLGAFFLIGSQYGRICWNDVCIIHRDYFFLQRRHLWADLLEIEEDFRNSIDSTTDLIFPSSKKIKVAKLNEAHADLVGYARERLRENVSRWLVETTRHPEARSGSFLTVSTTDRLGALCIWVMAGLLLWAAYARLPLSWRVEDLWTFAIVMMSAGFALVGQMMFFRRIIWDSEGVRQRLGMFWERKYQWAHLEAVDAAEQGGVQMTFADGRLMRVSFSWLGAKEMIAYARSRLNA